VADSYVIAVKRGQAALELSGTKNGLLPVHGGLIFVNPGDTLSWVSDGYCLIAFERSPFQGGRREVFCKAQGSTAPERLHAIPGQKVAVHRYSLYWMDLVAGAVVSAEAHVVVDHAPRG
jgi:hypothetical protein